MEPERPAEPPRGLDRFGWYIAVLHGILGHDKAAAYIGQPGGDKRECIICAWERNPTEEGRQAVYEALAPEPRALDGHSRSH